MTLTFFWLPKLLGLRAAWKLPAPVFAALSPAMPGLTPL
jgi:hypothetical protein